MPRLLDACAEMTKGLTAADLSGLTKDNARTFGQKLYLKYGVTGIRGEAEQGFPTVRRYGYPRLKAALAAGLDMNGACCAALTDIMAHSTDTNVIHRSSPEAAARVSARAAELLERQPFPSAGALADFDRDLIRDNISPGGSADLLSLCCLICFLEEEAK